MSDQKKDKYKKSFSDFGEDLAQKAESIPFEEIGEKIKISINNTIKKFNNSLNIKDLPPAKNPKVASQKPPEIYKDAFYKVISLLLLLIFGSLATVFFDGFMFGYGLFNFLGLIITSILTIAFPIILWKRSNFYKAISNRYARYLRELGVNTVISVRDLAGAVNQSEEETLNDLIYMMKKGYFKQARLVEDGSIFILDIPTYKIYKEKLEKIPSYQRKVIDQGSEEDLSADEFNLERAREIIKDSSIHLDKLKILRENIKNLSFRENINKLIKNASDILKIIDKYPDKAYGLGKFSTYYLPTSIKLVDSYKDFEMLSSNDSNFIKSMDEINQSIKTIGDAFANMKNDLLGDKAMDVKTEIDTINLLLNQEGYIGDDWSEENE
ncbi:MAG: 5-bromo-4-chloroindolyl phosphate hydrolysis family protein [Anaerococcus sp.]|nr:5-bromo-4-chloroindolyl phosphate hydrolysis family protein [Anaerococcus sp.]